MSPAGAPSSPDRRPAGACRVCGNAAGNRRHVAREMMFGFRDAFGYVECAACGCLQIEEIPSDIGKYYPERYYSFQASDDAPLKRLLKRLRARHAIGRWNLVGWLLSAAFGPPPYARWVRVSGTGIHDPVLDVGCGSGVLLRAMREAGFDDLTGVDPYVAADQAPRDGIRILRRTLSETEGRYRLVLFSHSFEHLDDPEGALRESHRLLLPGGVLLLRLPVAGSAAWRRYGADWVQLDAPRHFFLHTEASIRILAARTGFEVVRVEWDSDAFQFWGSEQYARDIPLDDPRSYARNPGASIFSKRAIREFEAEARKWNERGEGDAACFYLRREP